MALSLFSLERSNRKVSDQLAARSGGHKEWSKFCAKIDKELHTKKPDTAALNSAFGLLVKICRQHPESVNLPDIPERLIELLDQRQVVDRRRQWLDRWGCAPEPWMSAELTRRVRRMAWPETLSDQRWGAAVRLALAIRHDDHGLFGQLRIKERLGELLQRVQPDLQSVREPFVAERLESDLARATLPTEECQTLPDSAWRLALILEAATLDTRDPEAFCTGLSALIEAEERVDRLTWILSAPWPEVFPEVAETTESQLLVRAATKLLSLDQTRPVAADRVALERLSRSRPTAAVEFVDRLQHDELSELLLETMRRAAAELGLPRPDRAAGTEFPATADQQSFEVVLYLFTHTPSPEVPVRQARRYVEVLAALASAESDHERARDAIAQRLKTMAGEPANWDLLAWSAARQLSPGRRHATTYGEFLTRSPKLARETILAATLEQPAKGNAGKLTALARGWRPVAGSESLQIRLLWRLTHNKATPDKIPSFFTAEAADLPEGRLVRAALAQRTDNLLLADSLLRSCRDSLPSVVDATPLAWSESWSELAEKLERWAAGELEVPGSRGDLWWTLSQRRREDKSPDGALLALAQHLAVGDPREGSEQNLADLLGRGDLNVETLIEAAEILLPGDESAAACLRVLQLLSRVCDGDRIDGVDRLLVGLKNRDLEPELAREVSLVWARRDATERPERLRQAYEGRELPADSVADELLSLPPETLADRRTFLWSQQVLLEVDRFDRAIDRFDAQQDPDTRARALDLLAQAAGRMPAGDQLAVAERWHTHHAPSEDPVGMQRLVDWLIEAFPRLDRDGALRIIEQGLTRLADLGDIRRVSDGVGFLNRVDCHASSRKLLARLLERNERLPDQFLGHYRETCQGLADPGDRSQLIYGLAALLETEAPEKALEVYADYFEDELANEAGSAEARTAFQSRLESFTAKPGGMPLAEAHLLAGRSCLLLERYPQALEFFRQASQLGASADILPHLETLMKISDELLRSEVRQVRVHALGLLQRPVAAELKALLHHAEEVARDDATPPGWLAERRQALLQVSEDIDSRRESTDDLAEEVGWTAALVWTADLGRPDWQEGEARWKLVPLLEALDNNPVQEDLAWTQERFSDRADEVAGSLLLPLLELICASGDAAYRSNGAAYLESFHRRHHDDPRELASEDLRRALAHFVAYADRLGDPAHEQRLWQLESDFAAADSSAAVSHARELVDGDSLLEQVLEQIEHARDVAMTPEPSWAEIWQLVLEIVVRLDTEAAARWSELGLGCLLLLAGRGESDDSLAELARSFEVHCAEALADPAGGGGEEAKLATAILAFLALRIAEAREILLHLLAAADSLPMAVAGYDPLTAYDVVRPSDAEGWGPAMLSLLEMLRQRLGDQSPDLSGEMHFTEYRIAIASQPPAVDRAIASLPPVCDAGEEFHDRYRGCLEYLLAELAAERSDSLPTDQEVELMLLKLEHLLEVDHDATAAVALLRPLIPPWPSTETADETLLLRFRGALAEVGTAAVVDLPLMLLRLDQELHLASASGDWLPAQTLAAAFMAGNRSKELSDRVLEMCGPAPEGLAIARRLARDDKRFLPALIERLETDDGDATGWHEDLEVLVSDHSEDLPLRRLAARIESTSDAAALHRAALIALRDEDSLEHLAILEDLSEENDTAALVWGTVQLGSLAEDPAVTSRIRQHWDRVLEQTDDAQDVLWDLLPAYAELEETCRDFDRAHRMKLKEARFKIHEPEAWEATIRLWKLAREQELAEIGEPENLSQALAAARILRLLLRSLEAITLLQGFRARASRKRDRGALLYELGLNFAQENRYDLARDCHRQADPLLDGGPDFLENRFAWGVAAGFLQQLDEAREIFVSVLASDVSHAAAQAALAKLDLPPGMLQLVQMTELSHRSWNGILNRIRGDS